MSEKDLKNLFDLSGKVAVVTGGTGIQGTRVTRGLAAHGADIAVIDLDAAVRELQAKGVDVSQPVAGPLPDTRIARIPPDAAHGVPLQLIERTLRLVERGTARSHDVGL